MPLSKSKQIMELTTGRDWSCMLRVISGSHGKCDCPGRGRHCPRRTVHKRWKRPPAQRDLRIRSRSTHHHVMETSARVPYDDSSRHSAAVAKFS